MSGHGRARRGRARKRRGNIRQAGLKIFLTAIIVAGGLLAGAIGASRAPGPGSGEAQPGKSFQGEADVGQVPLGEEKTGELDAVKDSSSTQAGQPQKEDWRLILVNPWNAIPEGYGVDLAQLKNGQAVDERCYPDLQEMMVDCRDQGLSPLICSSYRSQQKQEALFENRRNSLLAQGYSQEEARAEAGKAVALPGTSEHQLGLAVDIVDLSNQNLDESQEDTAVQGWLMENSWKYGFILRYPNGKSALTGIIYEPWHYRYVGREAAQEIYERGVCLEEYLQA